MCVFCKGTDDFAVVRVDLPFVAHVAGDGETHCAALLANQLFEMGFRLLLSMHGSDWSEAEKMAETHYNVARGKVMMDIVKGNKAGITLPMDLDAVRAAVIKEIDFFAESGDGGRQ